MTSEPTPADRALTELAGPVPASSASVASASTATDEPSASPEPGQPDPAPGRGRGGRLRWEAYALLEIAAVSGVALAQPLLDITGSSPDFFLFYGADRWDVLTLVAVFVLAPPLVLWTVGLLCGLVTGARVRRAVHVVTLGALLAVLAVQVGKQLLPVRGVPLGLIAALAGAALAAAYWRWDAAKQLVRLAGVGPVVFTMLFVFGSPASAVVLGGDTAGGAQAGDGSGSGGNPPIVMIVFDELPTLSLLDDQGKIDAKRYPNFARLAGTSTWYRNATAVSGWTPHAVPALFTGRYPSKDVAPHYSQHPQNLFTLLSARYDLKVQESITQLCPPRNCDRNAAQRGGLPTMLGESATLLQEIVSPRDTKRDPTASFTEPTVAEEKTPPPTDPKFRWDSLDDNQPVRFRSFVTGLADSGAGSGSSRPVAHVLHLLLPHTPWRYLPSGVRYDAPESLPTSGQWWPQLARQRHLLQLGYADLLLGETLNALRADGQFDDSLIVVTADHGVTFSADSVGRGLGHVRASPAETLWVPTLIKAPGQRDGAVDDRNWQHVDMLPTIAEHARVKVPWKTDGTSALGAARDTTEKLFYDVPGEPVTIDGESGMAVITGEVSGFPVAQDPPRTDLVGRSVKDLKVTGVLPGGPAVSVTNMAEFRHADPSTGSVPALLYGSLPDTVAAGSLLAIVVNGKIGAVVPALKKAKGVPRFAGMVPDTSLFTASGNRLEIYQLRSNGDAPGGVELRALPM